MYSSIAYIAVFFATACIMVASYFAYPWVEEFTIKRMNAYLSWVASTQEKMFRPVKRRTILIWIVASVIAMMIFAYSLSAGFGWITFFFVLLFALFGWSLPKFIVSLQWQRRLQKFDAQLIDALNMMANSLKSGLNLPQTIQMLVSEMPNPISQEFGLVLSQQKIGLTIDEALERMLERIPSEDLAVAIHSILILRETGGDLSETFETIANTIRERRKIEGKIKSLTAQGRIQGYALIALPFLLAIGIYMLSPDYLMPLIRSSYGWLIVLTVLTLQALGAYWIHRIVKIEV